MIFRILSIWRALRRLLKCRKAVSAVEFSLLAPVLTIGAISSVDAGMAVYDKMMMTQVLRSGAQSAIAAESEEAMMDILRATAGDNFTVAEGDDPAVGELQLDVESYCVCPSDRTTRVPCTATCSGGAAVERFYALSADKVFAGIILPEFTLSGEIDVWAQ